MTSTLSRLSEPSATSLMCSGRLFRPDQPGDPSGSELEPELGGDHHLLAEGGEGFAHEFFVRVRAVDLGGVEEGDAAFDGRPEQGNHLLLVLGRAVGEAHPHAAEADGRDFQAAVSEFALLHVVPPDSIPNFASMRGRARPDGRLRCRSFADRLTEVY